MSTPKKLLVILGLAIASLQTTSEAGILNGHASAYDGISGSVPFNDGLGLSGSVDYAVFTAANFSASFGGLGYVPGDGLVYTYQIQNSGSLGIIGGTITVPNPASTIGTFDIGGINAVSANLILNAEWTFGTGIASGQSSWGLAFSSLYAPIVGFATITGAQGSPYVFGGVPVPGHIAVSEPGSLALLALGVMALCLSSRIRGRHWTSLPT